MFEKEDELEYSFDGLESFRKYKKIHNIQSKQFSDDLLIEEEVQRLDKFNLFLCNYEKFIRKQLESIKQNNLWCEDIELYINFYLDENHVSYDEEQDNLLMKMCSFFSEQLSFTWGITDGNSHNTIRTKNKSLEEQKHCYILHCLYDHTQLSLDEILSIGIVDIQFNLISKSQYVNKEIECL